MIHLDTNIDSFGNVSKIYDEQNNKYSGVNSDSLNNKGVGKFVTFVLIILLFFIILVSVVVLFVFINKKPEVNSIYFDGFNVNDNEFNINIISTSNVSSCAIVNNLNDSKEWNKFVDGVCFATSSISDNYFFYLKNKYGNEYGPYYVSDYASGVIDFKEKYKTIYMPLNDSFIDFYYLLEVGNNEIDWRISDPSVISVTDNVINSLNVGSVSVTGSVDNINITFNVIVTDLIVKKNEHFDYDKGYLTCKKYTKEENDLFDKILEFNINRVGGYKSRAAVVEAARFLTLEFPNRIDYFFENGRLSSEGVNYVDGEGRYYHKGLYLSTDRYSNISNIYVGPAIWGCPLKNFEDVGTKYVSGEYMPNGLDCSGFVSWCLYNGGYDLGDRGAGDTDGDGEMTDLGERVEVTKELIESGKVKAGDLINWWGHIGIIVGIDSNTYYVAETLSQYDGLVIKEYSKEEMPDAWTYIMLMDSEYERDGLYTDMW